MTTDHERYCWKFRKSVRQFHLWKTRGPVLTYAFVCISVCCSLPKWQCLACLPFQVYHSNQRPRFSMHTTLCHVACVHSLPLLKDLSSIPVLSPLIPEQTFVVFFSPHEFQANLCISHRTFSVLLHWTPALPDLTPPRTQYICSKMIIFLVYLLNAFFFPYFALNHFCANLCNTAVNKSRFFQLSKYRVCLF